MRIILDTNLLVSALITSAGAPPSRLVDAWLEGRFDLVSSEAQIEEIKRATRYSKLRVRLVPSQAGELINQLRDCAEQVVPAPAIDASPDPGDDFLLGMAEAGAADYLVSGDKRHVLALRRWRRTHIVTAREMVGLLKLK